MAAEYFWEKPALLQNLAIFLDFFSEIITIKQHYYHFTIKCCNIKSSNGKIIVKW